MTGKKRTEEKTFEPWELLDWTSNGPHGAAKLLKVSAPCRVCAEPAWQLSPNKAVPMHKGCAEEFYLVKLLAPILVALGTVEHDPNRALDITETRAVVNVDDGPPDYIANPQDCRLCGNRLLLIRPGRDVCARCNPSSIPTST